MSAILVGVCRMDVSYHDMEEINKLQSIPDLERFLPLISDYLSTQTHTHRALACVTLLLCDSALCSVFGVDLPEPKRRALLELYVQTVLFCRELKFNNEQTSALLSIIKSIHEANVGKTIQVFTACH